MPEISEKIQKIIDRRAQHLPGITNQKEHLQSLLTQIDRLDSLVGVINNEIVQQKGPYYNMIAEDGKIEQAFHKVNTAEVRKLIAEELAQLENLEKRFSRKSICIAMIGYERQGKSTFLQTISGLDNNVIPAYSGTSCTGAVSVIHNITGSFRAEVEWYSHNEFLEIARGKLQKFFPKRTFNISSAKDLETIDISGFMTADATLSSEYNKFREAFCGHVADYIGMLGNSKMVITNPVDVIKHVAQYEEFNTPPTVPYIRVEKNDGTIAYQVNYYKYVAVKSVNIYTPFQSVDSSKIELVDTIGLGDSSNADKIEAEMFRVLREDCDAAVNLFKPDALGGGLNASQTGILTKISTELGDRKPNMWMFYVINHVTSGPGKNTANIPAVLKSAKEIIGNLPAPPVSAEHVVTIEGNNQTDVKDHLVNPLLDMITSNLPELDDIFMTEARNKGEQLFTSYATLVNNVESVLKNSMKHSGNATRLFRQLYKTLRQEFDTALTALNNKYKSKYLDPCPEVADILGSIIDGLYDTLPEAEEIDNHLAQGKALGTVYDTFTDKFSNNIFSAFESVSTDVIVPLRENVKLDMIKVLFNEGRMNKIRLTGYDVGNGPSVEWLECLIKEHVSQDVYPFLYEVLKFILDYHFNIEDAIESDVAASIGSIDKLNYRDFIPLPAYHPSPEESAGDFIFQELANRVPQIQSSLKVFKDRFALMPSHSFATRVNKFHTKVIRDDDTLGNLEEFYIDNEGSVWREDFQNQVDAETAFGQWNEVSDNLAEFVHKNLFIL